MPIHRSLTPILMTLFLLVASAVAPTSAQPATPPDRLLTTALIGAPVAAGNYIFWKQRNADRVTIYGYDLASDTRFVVAQAMETTSAFASDGAVVAWSLSHPSDGAQTIQSYDFRTGTVSSILTGIGGATEIAIDAGLLYYIDATLEHRGLFAREIASGHELLVSPAGRRPVAADGALKEVLRAVDRAVRDRRNLLRGRDRQPGAPASRKPRRCASASPIPAASSRAPWSRPSACAGICPWLSNDDSVARCLWSVARCHSPN